MQPSKRGILFIASGLVLALLPALISARLYLPWAAFWGIALLLFGADFVLAPRARGLRCDLTAPDALPVGAQSSATLLLTSRSFASDAEIKLDLSESLVPQPPQRGRLSRAGSSFTVPLVPLRRGPARVIAAWVRVRGPLGLLTRTARVPLEHPIAVVPNLDAVRGAALRFFGPSALSTSPRVERFVGDGSEFDSLEEFQAGLDHRSIDWKASARHGKLLSRRFRAERNRQIVLAVDTGRLMAEPLGEMPRLDHAIHASLLLAYVSARFGDRVSLYTFDEKPGVYTEPRSGTGAFQAIKKVTGDIDYTIAETNYTIALTELSTLLTRRSLVVVLTDFVDTVTAELMVENLGRLSGRHLVVFVALRDPLLGELALAEPATVLDINRAVVASALMRDREVVLRRLQRKGIFCIDAPPSRVGPDLLNCYLDIRRRELVG